MINNGVTYPKVGETFTCTVCGKEFNATDDTRYIAAGGYTCGWKCFLKHYNEQEEIKKGRGKGK